MVIKAVFLFLAKNPPSIAIAGGVLLYILGSVMLYFQPYNPSISKISSWAEGLVIAGFVLQVVWIFVTRGATLR